MNLSFYKYAPLTLRSLISTTLITAMLFGWLSVSLIGCGYVGASEKAQSSVEHDSPTKPESFSTSQPSASTPTENALVNPSTPVAPLISAARQQIGVTTSYDGSYKVLDYPMGDVVQNTGVCTDVVIRAYRKLGVDLQEEVHKDMKANFSAYPKNWGLSRPDSNIDHRRVPNLETYFKRHGKVLPITQANATYQAGDYQPGDIVTWRLTPPNGLPHIGIVSDKTSANGTPFIIHNIGRGTEESDILFHYKITGHFRYKPELTLK